MKKRLGPVDARSVPPVVRRAGYDRVGDSSFENIVTL